MTRKLTILALGLIGALLLSPAISEGRTLRLVFGRRTVEVREYRIGDERYVALTALLNALGAKTDWDKEDQALRARLDGREWTFWAGSAIVSIDEEARTLGAPVKLSGNELAAPLSPMVNLLNYYTGAGLSLRGQDARVEHGDGAVFGYQIDTRRNGVVIELSLSDAVAPQAFLSEGNWINLTLPRARLQPSHLNAFRPHPAVQEVRATQFASSAQISFKMSNPVDKYLITTDTEQNRLTLLIGDTSFVMRSTAVEPPPLEFDGEYDPVDRVVIDAGHGGTDFGATGRDQELAEKDITLAIAQRLFKRFEKNSDFEVVMTREEDRLVSLEDRAAVANEAGADVFISIHANSSEKAAARGCQTFFAGEAHSEDAQRLAELENFAGSASTGYQTSSDSSRSSAIRRMNKFQSASAELAELIQKQFEAELDLPSRGVDQAEFSVLGGVEAPGIMVYAAFLTNDEDEELLRRRSFQNKVAEAIYDAVLVYRAKLERAQAARLDQ